MSDLWTMIWKELKDEIFQVGMQTLIRPLIIFGIVGIVLPIQFGLGWLAFNPVVIEVVVYFSFFYNIN